MILLEVWVPGVPAPQGSKTRMPNGAMLEAGSAVGREKLRTWRNAVTATAVEHWAGAPAIERQPLMLELQCRMPRPKSRRHDVWHATKPDLSKLMRATEDALVDAGVLPDDCIIAQAVPSKRYVDDGHGPGALIRLRTPGIVLIVADPDDPEGTE